MVGYGGVGEASQLGMVWVGLHGSTCIQLHKIHHQYLNLLSVSTASTCLRLESVSSTVLPLADGD